MQAEREIIIHNQNYQSALSQFKQVFKDELLEIDRISRATIDNQPGFFDKLKETMQRKLGVAIFTQVVTTGSKQIGNVTGHAQVGQTVASLAGVAIRATTFLYFRMKNRKEQEELKETKNFLKYLEQLGGEPFLSKMADYLANRFLFTLQELSDANAGNDIEDLALFFTTSLTELLIEEQSKKITLTQEYIEQHLIPDLEDDLFKEYFRQKKLGHANWTIEGLLHRAPVITPEGDFLVRNDKTQQRAEKYPPQRVSRQAALEKGYQEARPLLTGMGDYTTWLVPTSASPATAIHKSPPVTSFHLISQQLGVNPDELQEEDLISLKESLARYLTNRPKIKKAFTVNKVKWQAQLRQDRDAVVTQIEIYDNKQKEIDKALVKPIKHYMQALFLYSYDHFLTEEKGHIPDLTECLYLGKEIDWLIKLCNRILGLDILKEKSAIINKLKKITQNKNEKGMTSLTKLLELVEILKRLKSYMLSRYFYAMDTPTLEKLKSELEDSDYQILIHEYKLQLAVLEDYRSKAMQFTKTSQIDTKELKTQLQELLDNIEKFIQATPQQIIAKHEKNSATIINDLAHTRRAIEALTVELLSGAIAMGDIKMVRRLLETYAFLSPDKKTTKGFTFLHEAMVWGHEAIAQTLCQAAKRRNIALPHVIAEDGSNLLHSAAFGCHKNLVQNLLNEQVPVNGRNQTTKADNAFRTPLHNACVAINPSKLEVIKLLVENGADFTVQDGHGFAPLHLVFMNRNVNEFKEINLAILQFFIEKKAKLDSVDHDGKTALHMLLNMALVVKSLDMATTQLFIATQPSLLTQKDTHNECAADLLIKYRKKLNDRIQLEKIDPNTADTKKVQALQVELQELDKALAACQEFINQETSTKSQEGSKEKPCLVM